MHFKLVLRLSPIGSLMHQPFSMLSRATLSGKPKNKTAVRSWTSDRWSYGAQEFLLNRRCSFGTKLTFRRFQQLSRFVLLKGMLKILAVECVHSKHLIVGPGTA